MVCTLVHQPHGGRGAHQTTKCKIRYLSMLKKRWASFLYFLAARFQIRASYLILDVLGCSTECYIITCFWILDDLRCSTEIYLVFKGLSNLNRSSRAQEIRSLKKYTMRDLTFFPLVLKMKKICFKFVTRCTVPAFLQDC